jgi:hypothetical protein
LKTHGLINRLNIVWLRGILAALLCFAAVGTAWAQAQPPGKLAPELRFTDLPLAIDTPAFAPGKRDFTSDAELTAFLARLDTQDSNHLTWHVIGKTPGGRDLHLLVLTAEGKNTPQEIAAARKPVVWILGLQHGNEPASGEAALELARRLTRGDLRNVLERINVVIAPRMNPDGAAAFKREAATVDLNRDHLDLASVENQALHRWMRRIPPHVVLDLHEFLVGGRWIERFNAVQASDVLLQSASHPEVADALRTVVRDVFDPALDAAFKRNGIKSHVYHVLGAGDKPVVQMGSNFPGIARNTFGLYGAVSYLIETRGIGLGRDHFQRRVGTHVIAVSAILRAAAQNADALKKAVATARDNWSGDITVDFASKREVRELPMLDATTGEERPVKVEFMNSLAVTPMVRRPIPVGYLLAPDQEAAAQRLANHGLKVQRLARAVDANVERYIVRALRQEPVDGNAQAERVSTDTQLTTLQFAVGSFYVSVTQPLGRVAAVMLEPESQGSLLTARLLKTASPLTSGLELPVWRLMTPVEIAGPVIEAQ